MGKSLAPPAVADYIERLFAPQSPVQQKIRDYTATLPDSQMLSTPDQSVFLSMIARLARARNALEIGTFTGYSALAVASALPPDGHLTCLDLNPQTSAKAQQFWQDAGLADGIRLLLGPAAESLERLAAAGERFDFAFIDADKTGYDRYYELLLPLMQPNAPILFDNMIRPGVIEGTPADDSARAIGALNQKLSTDPRVHATLLPLGPGMVLAIKK
ncbi:MAG TPA: class I SAM-dependent methyltransferase [Phycisphaerae bacterium]|nr:class I SAM-dependent methyltransferase [Phycisphaerae bacterium]